MLLRQRALTHRFPAAPIAPRVSREPAPLSFAQERLWFLEHLEPENSVYNICRPIRLFGNVNAGALEASLNEIIDRHETLRSAFRLVGGRPVQVVEPSRNIALERADLRALPTAERDCEIQRRIETGAQRPFDLSAGRLLRATLLRAGDQEYVLILMTHHSVSDAWSMGILTRELWTHYDAFSNRRPSPFAPLPVQYSDYAVWQRNWFQGEVLASQLGYWKKRLENLSSIDLPSDRPRTPRQSFRGARVPMTLPAALTAAVNELSNRSAVTPYMTLLAALQLLLFRYTDQEDIAVGSPIANRRRIEIEGLIGFFVNTLVLRADLSGKPSFKELLSRVKDSCVAADANQDLPFEKLVQELQPERDLSRNPLFQVMFVLQNATTPFGGIPGLRIEPMEIAAPRSPFDLSLFLRERDGRLTGHLEYSTDLFERATIERMAGHFQTLLEAIVANPDQSIATLPLMTGPERRQTLVEWNDTTADYPKDQCMHQLFEAQVERTPHAIALEEDNGRQITYREINRQANRLAHHLISAGVGPEKLVGICVERSIEMVVGLLGILKAGGAYVPLDPAYPKERLRFMVQDAQPVLLLSLKHLNADTLGCDAPVLCLDDAAIFAGQCAANPATNVGAENAAYVIYTSGSTGTPKGVIGLHRGAANRFAWMWQTFPFAAKEKVGQKTSLSFVDSVWEIFGALSQGITTVIAPAPVANEPEKLLCFLAGHKITRIVLVPSLLEALLKHCAVKRNALPGLRYCFSSGEALGVELAVKFHKLLPHCRLINLYGSSEVSADVTWHETSGKERSAAVAVGRPIANTQIFLLDKALQPVPLGVPGEIYVAGANLARGYLHRPELTAAKFIANPFGGEKNPLLYRTGDLARYRIDGTIEFLRRDDDEVKIRGNRVDLAEVQSVLNHQPSVQVSVIVAVDDFSSDSVNPKSLIAYFVSASKPPPAVTDLRSFLRRKLPEYMIPRHFIALPALPLLPNGKINRRALPTPDHASERTPGHAHAPSSEFERLVAEVWRELLKVEAIGVDDNFFELGGHSLIAAEVVGKLRTVFNSTLSLSDLFERPTVGALAGLIESRLRRGGAVKASPIAAKLGRRDALLTLGQEQLFIFSQLFGGGDFLNMPYAYRLAGALKPAILRRALSEVIRRHEILRTGFHQGNSRPAQRVRRIGKLKLGVVDLSRLPAQQKSRRLEGLSSADAARTFDVEQAPLLRAKLVRLAPDNHVLLLTLHHIVTDQWSMGLIRQELATLYDAFARGMPSPLAEPPFQFADYADWQRRMLGSGKFNRQLSYWLKRLAGAVPALLFTNGRKHPARFQSARHGFEIDDGLFAAVRRLARQEHCTSFMIFLTALKILLYRLTGQEDLRVGTLVANRSQPGTARLVGYFVNALVLRTRLSAKMSGARLLGKVRATCLSAYAHQDLPFEHLEAALEHGSNGRQPPPYQVMLNYRNQSLPTRQGSAITITSWDGKNRAGDPGIAIARLDLSFNLREATTKLTGAVNYKTDLFDQDGITGVIENYRRILTQLTTDPARRISRLATGSTNETLPGLL